MVRVGKEVRFRGDRETINDGILKSVTGRAFRDVNWSFPADDTTNIYGEEANINQIVADLNTFGFQAAIVGDAPLESQPDTEVPPTDDELNAQKELEESFNEVAQSRDDKFWDEVAVAYQRRATTTQPFRRFTTKKSEEQRASVSEGAGVQTR